MIDPIISIRISALLKDKVDDFSYSNEYRSTCNNDQGAPPSWISVLESILKTSSHSESIRYQMPSGLKMTCPKISEGCLDVPV